MAGAPANSINAISSSIVIMGVQGIGGTTGGTQGQVLKHGASFTPTWADSSTAGCLVLLQSQTPSNVASISFTSLVTGTYNNYLLVYSNHLPITTNKYMTMQFSTNGGSSYLASGYKSGLDLTAYNAASWGNSTSTTFFYVGMNNDNSGGFGSAATIYLQNLTIASATMAPGLQGTSVGSNTSGAYQVLMAGFNTSQAGDVVNAFQIAETSGNISTGTFTLYGILE